MDGVAMREEGDHNSHANHAKGKFVLAQPSLPLFSSLLLFCIPCFLSKKVYATSFNFTRSISRVHHIVMSINTKSNTCRQYIKA